MRSRGIIFDLLPGGDGVKWKVNGMTDEYQDLSSRAVRGEKDALRDLFALADEYKNQGKLQEAAEAFRDSAIAYRISAFHNLNRAESAESRSEWLTRVNEIYKRWIENHPDGMRTLPLPAIGITCDDIRRVVVEELVSDPSFVDIFIYLRSTLTSLGMQFYSPGGSIQRRVCILLSEIFGMGDGFGSEYLQNIEIRIGLDLLAAEITKRCETAD